MRNAMIQDSDSGLKPPLWALIVFSSVIVVLAVSGVLYSISKEKEIRSAEGIIQTLQSKMASLDSVNQAQGKELAILRWRTEFLASAISGGMIILQGERELPEEVESRIFDVVWQDPLASENEILQAVNSGFSREQLDSLAFACRVTVKQMMGEAIVEARELKKLGTSSKP